MELTYFKTKVISMRNFGVSTANVLVLQPIFLQDGILFSVYITILISVQKARKHLKRQSNIYILKQAGWFFLGKVAISNRHYGCCNLNMWLYFYLEHPEKIEKH